MKGNKEFDITKNKREGIAIKKNKRAMALGQITLMIIAVFAFAFILGEVSFVSGQITGRAVDFAPSPTTGTLADSGSIGNPLTAGSSGVTPITFSESITGVSAGLNTPSTLPQGFLSPDKFGTAAGGAQTSGFVTTLETIGVGLIWAGIAYAVGYMLGSVLGFDSAQKQALSSSLSTGASVAYALSLSSSVTGAAAPLSVSAGGAIPAGSLVPAGAQVVTASGATLVVPEGGAVLASEMTLAASSEAVSVTTPATTGFLGLGAAAPFVIGFIIAAAVFILTYKDIEIEVVKFQCLPWQAPSGGDNCEACNDNTIPCTQYRCKSLGANCEIVNSGTVQERCVNVNPNDVNPPIIKPSTYQLTNGHRYTNVKLSPPGPGFTIERIDSADGCLKAFTPLVFGIETNEPAQCKIDFNSTTRYEDMVAFMGGSNYYSYNHTEIFALPGAKAFENSSFKLENGKNLIFYIRCMDKNGNTNEAEYAVKFCMDSTPDTTAPKIRATSIINGGCVAEEQTSANVEFYTDEPADCKWGHLDQSYEDMTNTMECSLNLYQYNALQLFTCKAKLDGIARDSTNYYIRCKDQPGIQDKDRNKNSESYKFSLRSSTALKLIQAQPNNTVFGGVDPMPVELYTETLFGCDNGRSICFYSDTPSLGDQIMFFDTDNKDGISTQRLDLREGDYTYYLRCVDSGGNVAEKTINFEVDIDTSAPRVARIYEEGSMLKIITTRNSECVYTHGSCDFTFNEGTQMPYANSTVHVAEWDKDKTYYIKCRDEFLNEEASCSAIVKPSRKLFA